MSRQIHRYGTPHSDTLEFFSSDDPEDKEGIPIKPFGTRLVLAVDSARDPGGYISYLKMANEMLDPGRRCWPIFETSQVYDKRHKGLVKAVWVRAPLTELSDYTIYRPWGQ